MSKKNTGKIIVAVILTIILIIVLTSDLDPETKAWLHQPITELNIGEFIGIVWIISLLTR